jgi:thiol-disulfide isomerase/thioredoxin
MLTRIAAATFFAIAPAALAQSLAGLWDATVKVNDLDVPFRIELSGQGSSIKGTFFNGDERFTSSGGRFENGSLHLNWEYFAANLDANFKDGTLEGNYTRSGSSGITTYPFRAKRFSPSTLTDADVPSIAGLWEIPTKSSKGELAWRFIVRQSGPEVSATILRVDGDTGALTGTYKNGKFLLSHFSGMRPSVLEVTLAKDGTLEIIQNDKTTMTAVRSTEARAKGLPEPTDPSRHTSVKDPTEPFQFSFPDLNGRLVKNTDAKFRGKVVLVNITGSWCPNCHDEAPFLAALYRKYRGQGLEIVALSFEEADQLKDPVRLRAFMKRYGIEYTVLLGGETSEAKDKLTQAVNWNAWPTTFFIGRDGLVRGVHAGFPSSASGDLFRQAQEDFTASVERLLAENARSSR